LTAFAAVMVLGERPNERLFYAGIAILGGIALAVLWPQRRSD
jgi:drug/metabolite transporter (DMT)-like permease